MESPVSNSNVLNQFSKFKCFSILNFQKNKDGVCARLSTTSLVNRQRRLREVKASLPPPQNMVSVKNIISHWIKQNPKFFEAV